ncbi:hypothetical protein VTK26DRAFT_7068 [Humicola hyalothermophila]
MPGTAEIASDRTPNRGLFNCCWLTEPLLRSNVLVNGQRWTGRIQRGGWHALPLSGLRGGGRTATRRTDGHVPST